VIIRKKREDERKAAVEKCGKKYPLYKIILAKLGGGYNYVLVRLEDFQMFEKYPLLKGKYPRVVTAMGAKPTAEHIISVEWIGVYKEGNEIKTKQCGIDGSLIDINDAGEPVKEPGIVCLSKQDND